MSNNRKIGKYGESWSEKQCMLKCRKYKNLKIQSSSKSCFSLSWDLQAQA